MNFRNLTPVNGFDFKDLNNARQNNYAWSMNELDDFIYVGTGRNILVNIIKAIQPQTQLPALIKPDPIDNAAEIWRYKKDGTLPWERVYKAPQNDNLITGFRFMIQHRPFGGSPALYAAGLARQVTILKSTNGVNWFPVNNTGLQGTSSRAMVVKDGKIFLATINEASPGPVPLLYSSPDPEFYPWKLEIDSTAPGFDAAKNPQGAISNMAVFNDKLYVATSNSTGAQVWRTNGPEPKLNDWTLIVDNGFGDPANVYTLAIGVFKDYLYVSGTKQLPQSWFIPRGCDVIRIDKKDRWQLVVGGNPLIPLLNPDEKGMSLSRLGSGFNNPFNVYAWQIQEFQGKLLISTFDDSSNMEVILDTLLANRAALNQLIGEAVTTLLIEIYKAVVELLRLLRYPIGFDLYESEDGINFKAIFKNGLYNPHNYGGRILFVDCYDKLYLGTANPFQGCEVWKTCHIDSGDRPFCDEAHYRTLWEARELINNNYKVISENMSAILQFIPQDYLTRFVQ